MNPYINEVEVNGSVVMSVRDTTAVASDVAQGKTFYLASGQKSVGTATGGAKPEQSKTATANGTVYPDSGYALSSVTVAIPYYEGW